jgi:hypothetical protein
MVKNKMIKINPSSPAIPVARAIRPIVIDENVFVIMTAPPNYREYPASAD